MPRRVRPAGLLLGGIGLLSAVGSVVIGLAAPAGAQTGGPVTVKVAVSQSDYFWREQLTNVAGQGAAPPQRASDPSVPSGDLAVAGPEGPDGTQTAPSQSTPTQTGPEKETYLAFDLSAIPVGATIDTFRLTLPVDPAGQNVNVSGQEMVACAPQGDWSAGSGADSFSSKPADQCAAKPPALAAADSGKAFSVDITPIAQQWVQAGALNFGVAITDNPANNSTPYQVVFGPAAKLTGLTATVTYTPPFTLAATGGTGTQQPLSTGPSTAIAPAPPVAPGGSAAVPAAPTSTLRTSTAAAAAPVVAGNRVADVLRPTSHFPGASSVLAAIGLLALLVAALLVLNDNPLPQVTRSRHRLDRALRNGVPLAPSRATSA